MKEFPVKIGVLKGNIILGQIDDESGQEQVITISPDQVEPIISGLRIASDELRKSQEDLKS